MTRLLLVLVAGLVLCSCEKKRETTVTYLVPPPELMRGAEKVEITRDGISITYREGTKWE